MRLTRDNIVTPKTIETLNVLSQYRERVPYWTIQAGKQKQTEDPSYRTVATVPGIGPGGWDAGQLAREQELKARVVDSGGFIYIEELEEPVDCPFCPACDGPSSFLGTLGTLNHFRCSHCGWTFSEQD